MKHRMLVIVAWAFARAAAADQTPAEIFQSVPPWPAKVSGDICLKIDAARKLLEFRPVATWQDKAVALTAPRAVVRARSPDQPQALREVALHVDVVEGIGEANGKLQSASTGEQGLKRTVSAHAVAIEKRWMSGLGADQIIAAIMCRSNHQVVPGERLERALKHRRRQVWAVAVEGNDTLPARRCEVRKH